jgi:Ribonuclease G/E
VSQRLIYLDRAPGEVRGVITLDDHPERLIVRRDDDDPRLLLGARLRARVASVEPALMTAFLDLGGGAEAILPFKSDQRPVRGQALEIEIRAEPRRGKLAIGRWLANGQGEPELIQPAPDVAEELRAAVRGVDLVEGVEARAAADEAQAEALEILHPLPGGGMLAVEPTRALTAIDVDLGERKGADAKRVTRTANMIAITESARLLRLKALGGIIILDLVGRGHDAAALMGQARAAFGPDNPGVAIGAVGRFGTVEISLPRRRTPLFEFLCRADGAPSDRTLAQAVVRRLESEGQAQPGARLTATCSPAVAEAVRPLVSILASRMGSRFDVRGDSGLARDGWSVA